MDPEFLNKQEERRARLLPDQFYDITTWSLPALFDVDCALSEVKLSGRRSRFDPGRIEAPEVRPATVAYLVPWGSAAAAAMAEAARLGVLVRSAGEPFSLGGRKYGIGAAIIRVAENAPTLRATLQALAAKWGVEMVAAAASCRCAAVSSRERNSGNSRA